MRRLDRNHTVPQNETDEPHVHEVQTACISTSDLLAARLISTLEMEHNTPSSSSAHTPYHQPPSTGPHRAHPPLQAQHMTQPQPPSSRPFAAPHTPVRPTAANPPPMGPQTGPRTSRPRSTKTTPVDHPEQYAASLFAASKPQEEAWSEPDTLRYDDVRITDDMMTKQYNTGDFGMPRPGGSDGWNRPSTPQREQVSVADEMFSNNPEEFAAMIVAAAQQNQHTPQRTHPQPTAPRQLTTAPPPTAFSPYIEQAAPTQTATARAHTYATSPPPSYAEENLTYQDPFHGAHGIQTTPVPSGLRVAAPLGHHPPPHQTAPSYGTTTPHAPSHGDPYEDPFADAFQAQTTRVPSGLRVAAPSGHHPPQHQAAPAYGTPAYGAAPAQPQRVSSVPPRAEGHHAPATGPRTSRPKPSTTTPLRHAEQYAASLYEASRHMETDWNEPSTLRCDDVRLPDVHYSEVSVVLPNTIPTRQPPVAATPPEMGQVDPVGLDPVEAIPVEAAPVEIAPVGLRPIPGFSPSPEDKPMGEQASAPNPSQAPQADPQSQGYHDIFQPDPTPPEPAYTPQTVSPDRSDTKELPCIKPPEAPLINRTLHFSVGAAIGLLILTAIATTMMVALIWAFFF